MKLPWVSMRKGAIGFCETLITVSEYVAVAGLAYMFGVVVIVVFLRYLFNFPIPSGLDQAMAMVPFVMYVPAASALKNRILPVVEVITQKAPPSWKNVALIFNLFLAVIFVGILLWATAKFAVLQYQSGEVLTTWRIVPFWVLVSVSTFGIGVLEITVFYYLCRAIAGMVTKNYKDYKTVQG